jgi:hypothetical protein
MPELVAHFLSVALAERKPALFGHTKGLFSWQNFWRNATVAVSLLFGKYCPIMV